MYICYLQLTGFPIFPHLLHRWVFDIHSFVTPWIGHGSFWAAISNTKWEIKSKNYSIFLKEGAKSGITQWHFISSSFPRKFKVADGNLIPIVVLFPILLWEGYFWHALIFFFFCLHVFFSKHNSSSTFAWFKYLKRVSYPLWPLEGEGKLRAKNVCLGHNFFGGVGRRSLHRSSDWLHRHAARISCYGEEVCRTCSG